MKTTVARLIGTWFGCGYSPVAPGTAGSLGALAIALALHILAGWGPFHFGILALCLAGPAVAASHAVAISSGKDDPSIVVVDEVIGQWIALAGVSHYSWKTWLGAFVLFRLFDIWKPAPVRQLENLRGGVGIVADDVMAGIYAALALHIAGRFNLY
ncbi:MAG: phosphatidylglycerophosphatase A [Bryobacteraceae bacterium]|nr:phosphatidylglycerophosphatase A [Bryobacteraceae bacterium]